LKSKEDYIKANGRKNTNGLVYVTKNNEIDVKLNEVLFYKIKAEIGICKTIKELNTQNNYKLGHLQLICKRYNIPLKEFTELESIITMKNFNDKLDEFLGEKMFIKEQQKFKNFIRENALKTVDKNRNKTLGVKTINGFFEDNKIMYRIESLREMTGENKFKRYWKLFKLN
jgi:hypothetical protein